MLRIIAERSGCEHGRRCAEVQLAHRDIAQAAAVSVPTVIRTLARCAIASSSSFATTFSPTVPACRTAMN
ncbi:MAG: hypothetical protein ACLTKG_06530 [Collinsella intestinalis]